MNETAPYFPNALPQQATPLPQQAGRAVPTVSPAIQAETWTLKERIGYSFLGLVTIGGALWLGRKIYRDVVSNSTENKSFEDGTPQTVAKQIKMAFDNDGWWGTDTKALRTALRSVTSQEQWKAIVKSYQKLYARNLLKDMSGELQTTEYNEMMQIVNAKPDKPGGALSAYQYSAWAKRFKAAFDKTYGFLPGTDEAAINAVLMEIPTQDAFIKVGVQYKTQFGTNLLDDLKAESEFGEYDEWIKTIVTKRKQ